MQTNANLVMPGSSIRSTAACGAILALVLCAPGPVARAANIGIGSGARVAAPLRSMKDLRDQGLLKQRFDYSCGASALETILR